ncbi:MAG TPA: NADH-quinone oxidoreductase subunit N, partial [Acidimicrobiales bacterium]|nr:NADH-quinone oxidoreductase subunit N [Acidimicrobiales bacterium]
FVYGIALIYGATGTTQLGQIADFLSTHVLKNPALLLAGTALVLVGFAFKVAAVPFHAWSPDVYEGSPTPIVGFMASVVKVGAFTAVLRVLASGLYTQQSAWRPMVVALAAASMLVGAILALLQRNVKRMLAYSSISHAGFVLLGLWAATPRGTSSALYYLATYAVMIVGTFAIVAVVSDGGREDLSEYRGLAADHPLLAASLTVLLLAQAGVPFTTGFLAKLGVIESALSQLGAVGATLGAIAMVSAAIGAYFYLRVVLLAYAGAAATAPEPALAGVYAGADLAVPVRRLSALGAALLLDAGADPQDVATSTSSATPATPRGDLGQRGFTTPLATAVVIACCVVPTVVLGIWAGPLADLTQRATMLFHP